MKRSIYTDHKRRVTSERSKKYRGIALISLSQIVPHSSICRALDPRNVDRLREVFSKEGYRRLDVPNHITTVVSSDSLDATLQKSRTSAAQLISDISDEYPHLQFSSGQVKCLHRQHRLKAGEEFLADYDQFANINIRQMPILRSDRRLRLQQLKSHDNVRAAVNSLLALLALLEQGMKLCSISRALAIGYDKLLEFQTKTENSQKGLFLAARLSQDSLQLSNVWYLESSANCLKRLVSLNKFQPTIKRAIRNTFSQPPSKGGDCLVQMSETQFQHCKSLRIDLTELAYRQIWLYAIRHYPKMAKEPENQDQVEKADPRVLYDLAVLARKLGYQSDQIKALLKHSPNRQIAREALLKARNNMKYKYDNDIFDSLVDRVAECFQ
ncbi:hypothetical protein N7522_011600 [Penicillium canescens]|nr:hypothetical protein N7522_011600 [Penicillium canescens]